MAGCRGFEWGAQRLGVQLGQGKDVERRGRGEAVYPGLEGVGRGVEGFVGWRVVERKKAGTTGEADPKLLGGDLAKAALLDDFDRLGSLVTPVEGGLQVKVVVARVVHGMGKARFGVEEEGDRQGAASFGDDKGEFLMGA